MTTSSKKWTADQIDISGKTIIVTGGNSGLGLESVKTFAANGAKVIMTSRSVTKGEEEKYRILQQHPAADISVMALDLSDLGSVKRFADEFASAYRQLDVLLNNAGIMMVPYGKTKDGFESQLGTNHLGHFALTGHLLELLKASPGSRVVNVSSLAHIKGEIDFDNLMFDDGKDYSPMRAYRRSKLANLLFTYELDRHFRKHQVNSIAVAAHPGVSPTNLARHLEDKILFRILKPIMLAVLHPPAKGALPQIRASIDPNVSGSEYYGPDGFREFGGDPVIVRSNHISKDLATAQELWDISEKLTGVIYPR